MTFDEYRDWLIGQDPLIANVYDMGDGTCCYTKRLMFHWTLIRADIGDTTEYFDRWCYADQSLAELAVQEWRSRGWDGEPIGWHRHPGTGRRRPNGVEAEEYVAY